MCVQNCTEQNIFFFFFSKVPFIPKVFLSTLHSNKSKADQASSLQKKSTTAPTDCQPLALHWKRLQISDRDDSEL